MENTSSADKAYTVFIDLDNTLIRKVSGRVLAYEAARKGLIKPYSLLKMAFFYLLYKISVTDAVEMSEKLMGWTSGMKVAEFESLCHEATDNHLLKFIDNEMVAETGHHEIKNARIVILSASVIQVCSRINDYLEFDGIICSLPETENDRLTGRFIGKLCFGDEKLKRLRDYCQINGINISESWYYGDSISDLPVFYEVGHPVCVNPGRKLTGIVTINNWKILNTRD